MKTIGARFLITKMQNAMRENGYASIGHLFEWHVDQFNEGYKTVLFQLVTKIYIGLDENIVDRTGFRQFGNFFQNVPVTVESATKFIRGILKRHEVNDFSFQIIVEKLVWRMVKLSFIEKESNHTADEDLAFRLFCLFNRFCETDEIPMKLSSQALYLLYSWLCITEPPQNVTPTFGNILHNIWKRKDSYLIVATKKAYDEYVRDILIEQRMLFKTRKVVNKNGNNYSKIGKLYDDVSNIILLSFI